MKNHLKFSAIIAAYFFVTTALLPLQAFANKITLKCPLLPIGEKILLGDRSDIYSKGIADLKHGKYIWSFWAQINAVKIPAGYKRDDYLVNDGNAKNNEKVLYCNADIGKIPVSAILRIENVSKCVSKENGSFICEFL